MQDRLAADIAPLQETPALEPRNNGTSRLIGLTGAARQCMGGRIRLTGNRPEHAPLRQRQVPAGQRRFAGSLLTQLSTPQKDSYLDRVAVHTER